MPPCSPNIKISCQSRAQVRYSLKGQGVCAVQLPDVWGMVAEMDSQVVDGWSPGDIWEYVNNPLKAWSQKLIESIAGEKYRRQWRYHYA